MAIIIEVKHDKLHNKWHRLSVRLHSQCPHDTIVQTVHDHLYAYAAQNQMNPSQIAARAVDERTGVVYNRVSDATQNRLTQN